MIKAPTLKWGSIFLTIAIILGVGTIAYQFPVDASRMADKIDSSGRKVITWDYAVESAEHGFNGTLYLTEKYGKYNLTPSFDAKNGPSDSLGPALLQDSLSMYKITHNQTYLAYAREAADSLQEHMLNDKGIIRNYSHKTGASNSDPTDSNFYLLPAVAIWQCTIPHTSLWPKKLPTE